MCHLKRKKTRGFPPRRSLPQGGDYSSQGLPISFPFRECVLGARISSALASATNHLCYWYSAIYVQLVLSCVHPSMSGGTGVYASQSIQKKRIRKNRVFRSSNPCMTRWNKQDEVEFDVSCYSEEKVVCPCSSIPQEMRTSMQLVQKELLCSWSSGRIEAGVLAIR